MGFQFEQHRLGLWDLSWDLKKKPNFLGNGIRNPTPFHDPLLTLAAIVISVFLYHEGQVRQLYSTVYSNCYYSDIALGKKERN